jgi:hypothetical protein
MIVLIDWLQMPSEAEGSGTALAILPDRPNVRVRFSLDADGAARVRTGLLTAEPVVYELDEDAIEEISVEWDDDDDEDDLDDEDEEDA